MNANVISKKSHFTSNTIDALPTSSSLSYENSQKADWDNEEAGRNVTKQSMFYNSNQLKTWSAHSRNVERRWKDFSQNEIYWKEI
jgi:hypothetical protein